jgi:signal transduction histidine kinase
VRLSEGHPVVNFENRYLADNGTWKWLSWQSAPLADRGLIYAVARDVTESKRIEARMKAQSAELERSNRDLEQFAYVASHDLRAPLRAMANLADWVEEDLPGEAPPKVREHLEKLRARLSRMEQLTGDLLEYSRAGTGHDHVQKVDTALMVSDIAAELEPPPGFRVVPRFGLPSFETARSPLEQVLRNLISNAIKHHHRDRGEVIVSAVERGDWYEFRVEDDGPGIPEDERVRIFQMFHRLVPEEMVEGTGMGLAMVKRIVEGAGGAIRVESGKGGGSAFYFTWPKVMPPQREADAEDPGRR